MTAHTFVPTKVKIVTVMKRSLFLSLVFFMSLNFSLANMNEPVNNDEEVKASWYGGKFHGRLTASGERYNMNDLTAAHKTIPFGTKVKITNVRNGKSVIVTINDRGPYVENRKFDLSKAAFHKIAKAGRGVITVTYELL